MRVEHDHQANSHGRAVGANMAGANEPYRHQPFFYSDLFELGYEACGDLDPRLNARAKGRAEPQGRRFLSSHDEGRPRGLLMVGDPTGRLTVRTELIAGRRPVTEEALDSLTS